MAQLLKRISCREDSNTLFKEHAGNLDADVKKYTMEDIDDNLLQSQLLAYVVNQRACKEATYTRFKIFEVLKIVFGIFVMWKIITNILYAVKGIDLRGAASKWMRSVEGLVAAFVAMLLIMKFDTTRHFLEGLSLESVYLLLAFCTLLFILLMCLTFPHKALLVLVVGLSILFVALLTYGLRKKYDLPKRLRRPPWRLEVPTFTDTFFVSVGAWMLLADGVSKLR